MITRARSIAYLLTGTVLACLAGCATAPKAPVAVTALPSGPGTYHRVERGETLWRISKLYSIDIHELADVNRISDTSSIEVGQQLFIPRRTRLTGAVPVAIYAGDDFMWPLKGKVIAGFGSFSNNMVNEGINIQPQAERRVVASRAGKVVFASQDFSIYGKTVIIDHGDGFSSVYARNAELYVKAGDIVHKGAVIAMAGQSGRDRNEYLHFQIRKGSTAQNPTFYLP